MTGRWDREIARLRLLPSGVVRIGPYSTAPAGLSRLNLPGATALVDPMTPHCAPTIEVSSIDAADETVRILFGAEVAETLFRIQRDADKPVADVAAVYNPRLRDIQLLGHLLWITRTQPWPLPTAVLLAELIIAADTCLDLIEDPETVRQAVGAQAQTMRAALTAPGPDTIPASVLDELTAASRAVSRALPLTDPDRARLMLALESTTARRQTADDLPAGAPRSLVEACTPHMAGHAGSPGDTLYTGSATADWYRNQVGLVRRTEDNVTWTAETHPSTDIDITVVAAGANREPSTEGPAIPAAAVDEIVHALSGVSPAPSRQVACSLHTPAWPLALREFLLTPHDVTGDLAGHAHLSGPAAHALQAAIIQGSLIVDVHDAGYRYAHLGSIDPAVEAARRWSTRALYASRRTLTLPRDPATMVAARGAWHRALALWRETDTRNTGTAQERARHSDAWLKALDGQRPTTTETPAPDLADAVETGDLTGPGATATLSELLAGAETLGS